MNRSDFLKLVGAREGNAEYVPVACLLSNGYACAGYYNTQLNQDLDSTCVLVNARLVGLRERSENEEQPTISDFNEFLEEIVQQAYRSEEEAIKTTTDIYGRSIPLAAIPLDQIVVVYPIAHIREMMRQAGPELHREAGGTRETAGRIPSFQDFDRKSIVLRILRTKLW